MNMNDEQPRSPQEITDAFGLPVEAVQEAIAGALIPYPDLGYERRQLPGGSSLAKLLRKSGRERKVLTPYPVPRSPKSSTGIVSLM
jgi:hypothetical protein